MKLTNRLYSYPVLSEEKDDYCQSVFEVSFNYKMSSVNTFEVHLDINMDNPELNTLIAAGKAEFVAHIECSATGFRTSISSPLPELIFNISISSINGTVEVSAFIISKCLIKEFISSDWNEDYEGLSFYIEKAYILAYKNLPTIEITKDFEEFTSASSIFMIYKRVTEADSPFDVNMESDKIKIGLGTSDYEIFSRFSRQVELQPILHSMLILPALVYVIEELRTERGVDIYRNTKWFLALAGTFKTRNTDFLEEINNTEDKPSIILAQEIMEYPISKALSRIASINSDNDEMEES